MGWQQSLFPLLIISAGPGFSGEFVYDPAPGAGNLIASVAGNTGKDNFGNAYVAGIMTYTTVNGVAVALGFQLDGQTYFATAPTPAGPYTPASGVLRQAYGTLVNGFSATTDVNGMSDPPVVTQLDAGTIAMAGRLLTPSSGPVLLTTFATLGAPFLLPPSGSPVPEFPTGNAGGNQGGSVILRPNGNMQLTGNFGNGVTVYTSGTIRWQI